MARPQKLRKVCSMPCSKHFGPLGKRADFCEIVTISVDEYETIRLIDLEGMTQEACAEKMKVARTTVQAMYIAARKKLAELLVNGKMLHIEGGHVRLCDGKDESCRNGACCKRRRQNSGRNHAFQTPDSMVRGCKNGHTTPRE